jgi:hypothetical protein
MEKVPGLTLVFYSRNRTKNITVLSTCDALINVIAVFVDNGRDTQVCTKSYECIIAGHSKNNLNTRINVLVL